MTGEDIIAEEVATTGLPEVEEPANKSKVAKLADDRFWENLSRISMILGLITSLFVIFYYVKQIRK